MPLTILGPSALYPSAEIGFSIAGQVDGVAGEDQIILASAILATGGGAQIPATVTLFGPHGAPAYTQADGKQWYVVTASPLWLKVMAAPPAGAGPCSLTLTFQGSSPAVRNGAASPLSQALRVPLAVKPAPATVLDPLPGLALWQSRMMELADKWAPQIGTLGMDDWYYDLPRVYFQISDYVQSNKYVAAALASAKQYMAFFAPSNGAIQGYEVFPRGLRMCWERTQDRSYLDAMMQLKNCPWVSMGGDPDAQYIRETAYAAMAWMEFARVEGKRDPRLAQSVEFLLGHFDQCFVQNNCDVNQPFFAGLAAEALIDWYDLTGDARVIEALKLMTETIWRRGVDPSTGMVLYDLNKPTGDRYAGLNLLFVNAWGFLYEVTHDRTYRDQGDILFAAFNNDPGGGISWSSKMFGQNYRSAFDYVNRFRRQPRP